MSRCSDTKAARICGVRKMRGSRRRVKVRELRSVNSPFCARRGLAWSLRGCWERERSAEAGEPEEGAGGLLFIRRWACALKAESAVRTEASSMGFSEVRRCEVTAAESVGKECRCGV